MKVLFLTTLKAYRDDQTAYNNIKEVIQSTQQNELVSNVDFFNVAEEKPEEYVYLINKLKKDVDIVIADIDRDSTGIGYEIEWAVSNKKPTLIIYGKKNENNVSIVLKERKNRYMSKTIYSNDTELKEGVSTFLKNAKNLIDTKFILIIPAEIDRYLEWASKEKRMHKAQLVREAIETLIEKDAEYNAYLESL